MMQFVGGEQGDKNRATSFHREWTDALKKEQRTSLLSKHGGMYDIQSR